ncbi:hypothetical protein [Marinicrinis lubricantis]|uniref:Uncharacterized protein n=1 Tax=Marinicrinis lubricantis TaxID=2086470 RepID=A0ABW1IS60_9BACL
MKQDKVDKWIKGLLPVIIPIAAIVVLNMAILYIEGLEWLAETFYNLGYTFGSLMERLDG